jgi:hypothetical protein
MIWVKELETTLTHWERVSKEYRLNINLEKTVMLKLLRNGGKNSGENKCKRDKRIDTVVYLGSVVEKNGKIQNKINERIGKAYKCYNSAKSLLWNKYMERKFKLQYSTPFFLEKRYYYYGTDT